MKQGSLPWIQCPGFTVQGSLHRVRVRVSCVTQKKHKKRKKGEKTLTNYVIVCKFHTYMVQT